MRVTGNNVIVEGVRVTGSGGGGSGVVVTSSGSIIRNCISYGNNGSGFQLGAGNSIYNCDAYQNQGGIVMSGGGNCRNNISSHNGGSNFNLNAAVTQGANYTYRGGVGDVGFGGTNWDPYYQDTVSTSSGFLSLSASSQCIDKGDSLAGVVDRDILGRPRPYQNASPLYRKWDIGAYEMPFGGLWLHHFTVQRSPADTVAGMPIRITVQAYDQNNALFTTYNGGGNVSVLGATNGAAFTYTGVTSGMTDNGNGTGSIGAGAFVAGQFVFTVRYTVAYDSVLVRVATDSSGTSPSMMWYAGALARIQVPGRGER